MGVSLYYEVERETPLTEQENNKIEEIIKKYSETFEFKDIGEDFHVYKYDVSEPNKIFSGSTKLPMSDELDVFFRACLHWAECLTEIRKAVFMGLWSVSLEDTNLLWDEDTGWFLSDEL